MNTRAPPTRRAASAGALVARGRRRAARAATPVRAERLMRASGEVLALRIVD